MAKDKLRKDRIKYFIKKLKSFGCPDSYLEPTAKSMVLTMEKKDKQEAIKEIKNSIVMKSKDRTEYKILDYDGSQAFAIIAYIKWKFNITESDLKW